jgi:hypothetical protein
MKEGVALVLVREQWVLQFHNLQHRQAGGCTIAQVFPYREKVYLIVCGLYGNSRVVRSLIPLNEYVEDKPYKAQSG